MAEGRIREVHHQTRNMSKHVPSSVNIAHRAHGIIRLGVGTAGCLVQVTILPGVLLGRRDIISKFVLWTLAPNPDLLFKMMYVAILGAISKPCCFNWIPMTVSAICGGSIVITDLGTGIWLIADKLEHLLEYLIQHLLICLPLLIQPLRRNGAVCEWNRQESNYYHAVR
jgi:hypothetical protein